MRRQQSDYVNILAALKDKIRNARYKAVVTVNTELLKLYWEIGEIIAEQEGNKGWGAKVIDNLAKDLSSEFTDMKGFSKRNLTYMRDFALAYPGFGSPLSIGEKLQGKPAKSQSNDNQIVAILQGDLAKLSWYHHQTLLDKVKDEKTRHFYIHQTAKNGWSRDVMVAQIESNLHQRSGTAITNFKQTLSNYQSDLAQQTLKSPYIFGFLSMEEKMQETQLERALVQHLKDFMLELGKGFAYVGNQKNIVVDGDDFFLDLLFYNYHLHCFVIFELKIGDFKPEFAGKLNFYVNTVNQQLKTDQDQPTIGVLLCKTPNETVVKYSLQGIDTPIGVANYKLANALPKQLKSEMPTIEELEQELKKEIEELKTPIDKKYEKIKEMVKGLKEPKVKEKRNPKTSQRIFTKVVLPLRDEIQNALSKIKRDFDISQVMVWLEGQGFKTDSEASAHLKKFKEFSEYKIEIRLYGFKPAGTKAFDVWKEITVIANTYNYNIGFGRHQPQNVMYEKLYHELPTKQEFTSVIEKCIEDILDDIAQQIERIQKDKK